MLVCRSDRHVEGSAQINDNCKLSSARRNRWLLFRRHFLSDRRQMHHSVELHFGANAPPSRPGRYRLFSERYFCRSVDLANFQPSPQKLLSFSTYRIACVPTEMVNIITSFADSNTKVDLHGLLGAKQPRNHHREPSAACRIPMWSEHLNAPRNASVSESRSDLHTSETKMLPNDETVAIKSADGGAFDGPSIVVQSEIDGGRTLMWNTKLAEFDP